MRRLPGGLNVFKVGRNGDEFHPGDLPSKVGAAPMRQGDVVLMRTRGCGGWGDPLEREPDRVRRDVAFGYISEARARDAYGVALDGEVVTRPPPRRCGPGYGQRGST